MLTVLRDLLNSSINDPNPAENAISIVGSTMWWIHYFYFKPLLQILANSNTIRFYLGICYFRYEYEICNCRRCFRNCHYFCSNYRITCKPLRLRMGCNGCSKIIIGISCNLFQIYLRIFQYLYFSAMQSRIFSVWPDFLVL